ncbi:hypothetical protein ES319_A08G269400v1 [Gossypium barbadense]|uniref:Uncharacterized protein n=1 Tax=Gossypium barbadense TaxID=3634 RepID=A0A5J5UXB5_GOSBA|nr:hypothetical protein ES319_A08G269400v1 [Gossypium barbadense]
MAYSWPCWDFKKGLDGVGQIFKQQSGQNFMAA